MKKLNLNQLKVSSFVTRMDENNKNTAKGGGSAVYTECCIIEDTFQCTAGGMLGRCGETQVTNVNGGCPIPG